MCELPDDKDQSAAEEPPPFFSRWGALYAVVLAFLLALIVLFGAFGRVFTP